MDATEKRCAWVTLVMLGDDYVPGALVLAESLRHHKTRHKLICMVTPGVSPMARRTLETVYDRVLVVPSTRCKTKPLPGQKQRHRYGKAFLSRVFTKWFCLNLEEFALVCFVDADIAFAKNPDDLFNLKAPAGSFVNPWQDEDRFYNWPKHGDVVRNDAIQYAMTQQFGFVVFGSLVLLEPSEHMHSILNGYLDAAPIFGADLQTTSGPDELAICVLMHRDWTHIGPHYQAISWKHYGEKREIIPPDQIVGYHYHGEVKPWDMQPSEYPDLEIWFSHCQRIFDRATKAESDETLFMLKGVALNK